MSQGATELSPRTLSPESRISDQGAIRRKLYKSRRAVHMPCAGHQFRLTIGTQKPYLLFTCPATEYFSAEHVFYHTF